jgi:uncharacterized protein (DUF302 family)
MLSMRIEFLYKRGGNPTSNGGLITVASRFSVRETIDRLTAVATSAGLLVFARIDHADNAMQVGLELRPTELLIFGNPKGGTPLMQDRQTSGIDLPIKALAWEDEEGKVWLTYNEAKWLVTRHQLGARSKDAVEAIEKGQVSLARSIVESADTSHR